MCKFVFPVLLSFMACGTVASDTLDDAIKLSEKDHKYIFVKFSAPWCSPCNRMINTTYADPEIKQIITKMRVVSVNIDKDKETVIKFKQISKIKYDTIPAYYIIDYKFKDTHKPLRWGNGYRDKNAFKLWIKDNS